MAEFRVDEGKICIGTVRLIRGKSSEDRPSITITRDTYIERIFSDVPYDMKIDNFGEERMFVRIGESSGINMLVVGNTDLEFKKPVECRLLMAHKSKISNVFPMEYLVLVDSDLYAPKIPVIIEGEIRDGKVEYKKLLDPPKKPLDNILYRISPFLFKLGYEGNELYPNLDELEFDGYIVFDRKILYEFIKKRLENLIEKVRTKDSNIDLEKKLEEIVLRVPGIYGRNVCLEVKEDFYILKAEKVNVKLALEDKVSKLKLILKNATAEVDLGYPLDHIEVFGGHCVLKTPFNALRCENAVVDIRTKTDWIMLEPEKNTMFIIDVDHVDPDSIKYLRGIIFRFGDRVGICDIGFITEVGVPKQMKEYLSKALGLILHVVEKNLERKSGSYGIL